MSEWRETKLSEVIELIGGGTPKTKVSEYWNGNIPWLSVVDFNTGNKFVYNTEKKITELGLRHSSTNLLEAGDIIISARGTVGVIAMLGGKMAFNQSCYGIKAIDQISTNNYVYYLLRDVVSNFLQIAHGGVFDTITRDTFKEVEVSLPPLSEQKAIAEVLSSLDDKIDLLHRQNKTLEQMAETLFRQWFVEEAQDDWEEVILSDIAEVKNGFSFSSKSYSEYHAESLEVFKMGHISKESGLKKNPKKNFVDRTPNLEKYILKKNDIVLAMTDMKDNVVILGVPAMIDKNNHYVLNQRVARIYLKSNNKLISPYLLYLQLKDKDNISILQSKANSGVQVNLTTKSIKDIKILIPPLDIQDRKSQTITHFFTKIETNDNQIRTLESLRDTLLPKLMSGKIRVSFND